jgi:hypothetical protein
VSGRRIVCAQCQRQNEASALFCGGCGQKLESAAEAYRVGALVAEGRYRIDAKLGEGGMGTVYRAFDVALERPCALKVLNAELVAHPTARRRMQQEARILARLSHPNVVHVRNIFEDGPRLVMELELVEGGDLETRIAGRLVEESLALSWMQSVLAGLGALHAAGMVHRDVKLANVLIATDGTLKLTDFGVVHDPTAQEKTQHGAVLGSFEAMAPEQISGGTVDARTDIYACGLLLYRLLAGRSPFDATSQFDWQLAHMRSEPNLGLLEQRGITTATRRCIATALAKAPDDRFPDAAAMAAALSNANEGIARSSSEPVRSGANAGADADAGSMGGWLVSKVLEARASGVVQAEEGLKEASTQAQAVEPPAAPRRPEAQESEFALEADHNDSRRSRAAKRSDPPPAPNCPTVRPSMLGEWRITTNVGGEIDATRGRYTMRREVDAACEIRTRIWRDGYTTKSGSWRNQSSVYGPWTVDDALGAIVGSNAYATFSARFDDIRVRFHLMREVGAGAVPGREVGAWTYETEAHPTFNGPAIAERAETLGARFTTAGYPRVDSWSQVTWSPRQTVMRNGVRVWATEW